MEPRIVHCHHNSSLMLISPHLQYSAILEKRNRAWPTVILYSNPLLQTDKIESVLIVFLLILDIIGLLLSTFTYSIQTTIGGTQVRCLFILSDLWSLISSSAFPLALHLNSHSLHSLYDGWCSLHASHRYRISIYRNIRSTVGRLGSPSFITTFYVGMGVGALLPSALSFAQGILPLGCIHHLLISGVNGSSFNFSYSIFIYIICVFVLISLAGESSLWSIRKLIF